MSVEQLDVRMAHLEGAYEQISERLRGVDGRLTALEQKIDLRFDTLDNKVGALEQKMDDRFEKQNARFDSFDKKLTTMMVGAFGTSAAMIAALIGVVVSHH